MNSAAPYRPRTKRDPAIAGLFWRGVYSAAVFGLLSGAAIWGFLALGGAWEGKPRNHAVASLVACGVIGALAAAAWTWGACGLDRVGRDFLNRAGRRLEWLVWPFTPASGEEGEDRRLRVELRARGFARTLLGLPVGIPIMAAIVGAGRTRELPRASLWALAGIGLAFWVVLLSSTWQWALGGAPPPPPPPVSPAARIQQDRVAAELDSSLQLAVAKARRAKGHGDNLAAIRILEQALQDAESRGRPVAHLELHWLLGWLYAKENNPDGAIVMFETVLNLAEPGSSMARQAQVTIDRLQRRSALGGH